MELGIGMFGDIPYDKISRKPLDAGLRLRETLEEVKLMDKLGLDVFAMGEHHRPDYAVSSPEIMLAAAAGVTQNIKLMSGVTVLSSSEPVNIYESFSMIDLISNGRAEIGVGRGSFTESFPLFGYNLQHYEELFTEKLDLLLKLNASEKVTWKGKHRPTMIDQTAYPRAGRELPIWIAVGGTPESVLRAAKLGLPMILAIIGGIPAQFKPFMDYYKSQYVKYGHNPEKMQLGVHAHTFVTENEAEADDYFEVYADQMNRVGASRGWPPYSKHQYNAARAKDGALLIGSAEMVIEKILKMQEMFGLTRYIAHMDVGAPSHEQMLKSIELFATKVAPEVRKALG